MTTSYLKLLAFLTATGLTDVNLEAITQQQINNIKELLESEIHFRLVDIEGHIGDTEMCFGYIERLRGYYEVMTELQELEESMSYIKVDIFIDDVESTPIEVLKVEPARYGETGSTQFMDSIAAHIVNCLHLPIYDEKVDPGDIIRFEIRGTNYYGEVKVPNGDELSKESILADYGMWAGIQLVEDNRHASPLDYLVESLHQDSIPREKAKVFLQSFYHEDTVEVAMFKLYGLA